MGIIRINGEPRTVQFARQSKYRPQCRAGVSESESRIYARVLISNVEIGKGVVEAIDDQDVQDG